MSVIKNKSIDKQILKEYIKKRGHIKKGIISGYDKFSSEEFEERHFQCFPQKEAFLMRNTDDWIVTPNDNPKKRIRRIFSIVNNEWTEFEKEELKKFDLFLKENKGKYMLPIENHVKEEDVLKFLLASKYDYSKTIDYIYNHINWRRSFFPFDLTSSIIDILQCGFLYSFGRDHRFRPILILNTEVYIKNSKKYSTTDWTKGLVYFLEYSIHHLLIPGQIEDWCVIIDLRNVSLMSFPSELTSFVRLMQSN